MSVRLWKYPWGSIGCILCAVPNLVLCGFAVGQRWVLLSIVTGLCASFLLGSTIANIYRLWSTLRRICDGY